MAASLKVITFLGTRPEIIRLSAVIPALDRHVTHCLAHTGQNYDYELSEVFFQDLGVRRPDRFLNADTSTLGRFLGTTLSGAEEVLREEQPDAVLVLGDTNSSFAAIMAKRLRIPVYHMEAGNRCFDLNVPEEINRRIIDHISDFNLVYTERARQHLIREGLPQRRIYLTGSPMKEVLQLQRERIAASAILAELQLDAEAYFLASVHREENVDLSANLREILRTLTTLAEEYSLPVIVSAHPRTRQRLAALGDTELSPRLRLCKPFAFSDYVRLQTDARCVISDSGTISEESAILGFPAITIRNAMERPEALDAGTIVLTGLTPENVLPAVRLQIARHTSGERPAPPPEYQISNTSERVVKLIVGTARLSNQWAGITPPDQDRT